VGDSYQDVVTVSGCQHTETALRWTRSSCLARAASKSDHAALRIWSWRLGRVYFLAFLNPSRGQPDPALTARLASPASVGAPAIDFD
jgi:hypothetical protein